MRLLDKGMALVCIVLLLSVGGILHQMRPAKAEAEAEATTENVEQLRAEITVAFAQLNQLLDNHSQVIEQNRQMSLNCASKLFEMDKAERKKRGWFGRPSKGK